MTPSELEPTDRKILELLAADGRMSFTDLGKATGLSTSAVHQRVKRLEQRELILGYGATVNHDEIGLPLTAFISIRPIDPSQPDDSPERLRDIPEIESCWSVAGEESYLIKVRSHSPAELEELLDSVNSKIENYEEMQFFAVVKDEWQIENGFLTPTMKIKRNVIEDTYEKKLDGWYASKQKVVFED